jgi:hypothetical protein
MVIAEALSRLGSPPARAGGDRAGWTALVAVVVLGIIGMHAIGLHGSQHADPGALAASSAMPVMGAHAAIVEAQGQVDVAVMNRGEDAPLVSPVDLGHSMAGMAMLCIAVLAGAALARMLIRSHRGSSVPPRKRVMTSTRVARRTDARQKGPPLVWAFSVIRC